VFFRIPGRKVTRTYPCCTLSDSIQISPVTLYPRIYQVDLPKNVGFGPPPLPREPPPTSSIQRTTTPLPPSRWLTSSYFFSWTVSDSPALIMSASYCIALGLIACSAPFLSGPTFVRLEIACLRSTLITQAQPSSSENTPPQRQNTFSLEVPSYPGPL